MSSTGNKAGAMAGFTLLELLVVMSIMALGMALIPAMLISGTETQSLKADLRQIVSSLRFARSRAIILNAPVAMSIDTEDRQIDLDSPGDSRKLHVTTGISIDVPAAWRSDHAGMVVFRPDGSSSGGVLQLFNNAARYRVAIDWLTGTVTTVRE